MVSRCRVVEHIEFSQGDWRYAFAFCVILSLLKGVGGCHPEPVEGLGVGYGERLIRVIMFVSTVH